MRRSPLEIKLERYADGTAADMEKTIRAAIRNIQKTIAQASTNGNIGTNAREREKAIAELKADLAELEKGLSAHLQKLTDRSARLAHNVATDELKDAGAKRLVRYDEARTEKYFELINPQNGKNLAVVFTDKMGERIVRGLRMAVVDSARLASVEGLTMQEQNRLTQDRWAALSHDKNMFRFVDRSGRSWENARYMQMNTRTTASRAFDEAKIDTLTANGQRYAQISDSTPTECKVCAAWQGRIICIAGDDPVFPTYNEALEAGVFHPNCMHSLEYVDEDGDEFKLQKDFPAPDDMDDPESMQEQKDAIDEERYIRDGMTRDEAETEVMRDRIADNMRAGNVPTEDAEKIADGLSGDEVREIAKGGIPRFEPTKKGEDAAWNHGSAGGVVHYDRDNVGGSIRHLMDDGLHDNDDPEPPSVTRNEGLAIKSYTGSKYGALNRDLISGEPLSAIQTELYDDLQSVIAKAPEQRLKTYRGESYFEDDERYRNYLELEEGGRFKSKAFLSTSLKESVADDFTKSKDKGVRFTIYGRHGAYIAPHSEMPNEQEVLFKPDTKFSVLQRHMEDGILEIVLREM